MPTKYSPQDATKRIRSILKDGGSFDVSWHCRTESMADRNIDDLDIGRLLTQNGFVTGEPKWNDEHQNYVYDIEGTDAVGEALTAIVTFDEIDKEIFVITVY